MTQFGHVIGFGSAGRTHVLIVPECLSRAKSTPCMNVDGDEMNIKFTLHT